jgi:hypothetical protein
MAGTRRTPIRRPPHQRITREAVRLFKIGLQMLHRGVPDDASEFYNLEMELHRELGLRPWHEFIFNVGVGDVPRPTDDSMKQVAFEHVVSLRRALEDELIQELEVLSTVDKSSRQRGDDEAPCPPTP